MSSPEPVIHHHGPPQGFIRKYVFSLDHKVIGKQYYGLALVAVVMGLILSWLMRIHLGWQTAPIPLLGKLSPTGAPGNVMTPDYYLSLMTMHATIMVFFVLTTAPFAAFGNYFLPIQVGAEDMAFPRFNMMSFWVTFVSFMVLILAFFVGDGPPLGGLDIVCASKFRGRRGRAGPRNRSDPLGGIHRHLLHWPTARFAELHYHHARFAHQRHVAGAHAAVDLGMVRDLGDRVAGICGFIACLRAADSGSCGGNELLQFRPALW